MRKSSQLAIKVIVLLVLDVFLEIVAGYCLIDIKKDLDWVVNSGTTCNDLLVIFVKFLMYLVNVTFNCCCVRC